MDNELRQVQEEIVATKADLTKAEADKERKLVLSLTKLLVKLYEKEDCLSPGEMHYNRG
jgi:hypothetical protein